MVSLVPGGSNSSYYASTKQQVPIDPHIRRAIAKQSPIRRSGGGGSSASGVADAGAALAAATAIEEQQERDLLQQGLAGLTTILNAPAIIAEGSVKQSIRSGVFQAPEYVKKNIDTASWEKARAAGLNAVAEKVGKRGTVAQLAGSLPGGYGVLDIGRGLGFSKAEALGPVYYQAAFKEYRAQGFSPVEAKNLAEASFQANYKAGIVGETASLVTVAAGTEAVAARTVGKQIAREAGELGARKLAQTAAKREAAEITKRGVIQLGILGAGEGAAGEIVQARQRNLELRPENLVLAGVSGGLSSGALGFFPLRQSTQKLAKVTRSERGSLAASLSENVGYLADPTERPGELLFEAASKRARGVRTRVRTLIPSLTQSPRGPSPSAPTPSLAEAFARPSPFAPTETPKGGSPNQTPTDGRPRSGDTRVKEPPTRDFRSPVDSPSETPTETQTQTLSLSVATPVPTLTPIYRGPFTVPFPPLGDIGEGTGTSGGTGTGNFVDELARTRRFLRRFL